MITSILFVDIKRRWVEKIQIWKQIYISIQTRLLTIMSNQLVRMKKMRFALLVGSSIGKSIRMLIPLFQML